MDADTRHALPVDPFTPVAAGAIADRPRIALHQRWIAGGGLRPGVLARRCARNDAEQRDEKTTQASTYVARHREATVGATVRLV